MFLGFYLVIVLGAASGVIFLPATPFVKNLKCENAKINAKTLLFAHKTEHTFCIRVFEAVFEALGSTKYSHFALPSASKTRMQNACSVSCTKTNVFAFIFAP